MHRRFPMRNLAPERRGDAIGAIFEGLAGEEDVSPSPEGAADLK